MYIRLSDTRVSLVGCDKHGRLQVCSGQCSGCTHPKEKTGVGFCLETQIEMRHVTEL